MLNIDLPSRRTRGRPQAQQTSPLVARGGNVGRTPWVTRDLDLMQKEIHNQKLCTVKSNEKRL